MSCSPRLRDAGYTVTRRATPDYNCIAWAAGDDQLHWDFVPGYYWPHHMADPAADRETKNARQLALPGIGV